jgi:hypothetical protein
MTNEQKYIECKRLMAKDPNLKGSQAAKQVGLTSSSFYFYKAKEAPKKRKKAKVKGQVLTLPLTQPEPEAPKSVFGRKVAMILFDLEDAPYILGGMRK